MKDEIEKLKSQLATATDTQAGMRSVIVTCGNTIGFLSLTIANQVRRDNPAARLEANQSACKAIDAISAALSAPASQDGETKALTPERAMQVITNITSATDEVEFERDKAIVAFQRVARERDEAHARIAEMERDAANLKHEKADLEGALSIANEQINILQSEKSDAIHHLTAQHDAALARIIELEKERDEARKQWREATSRAAQWHEVEVGPDHMCPSIDSIIAHIQNAQEQKDTSLLDELVAQDGSGFMDKLRTQIKKLRRSFHNAANERDFLTAQLAILKLGKEQAMARAKELEEDGKLLDWLEKHVVEVRIPWRHGSRNLFFATPEEIDGEEDGPSNLRAAIRTAMTETKASAST